MKHTLRLSCLLMAAVAAVGIGILAVGTTWAHCDTTGGPILPEAKAALEKGDVTPVLKWIKADNEAESKAAFAKAVVVRAKGPEAKARADPYFLETLVRLHRAGEGDLWLQHDNESNNADARSGRDWWRTLIWRGHSRDSECWQRRGNGTGNSLSGHWRKRGFHKGDTS